jgi:hypothetical protein
MRESAARVVGVVATCAATVLGFALPPTFVAIGTSLVLAKYDLRASARTAAADIASATVSCLQFPLQNGGGNPGEAV